MISSRIEMRLFIESANSNIRENRGVIIIANDGMLVDFGVFDLPGRSSGCGSSAISVCTDSRDRGLSVASGNRSTNRGR